MMINPYPAGWREALSEQLRRWRQQFEHCQVYALIDGVHDDSCHALLRKTGTLPFHALYADTPSADDETLALSPLLVEHVPEHQQAWLSLLQRSDGLPSLSLIVTPESLQQLVRRLVPWCIVEADGQSLALSFADTRVLPELAATLTPAQWQQLCGPARAWQYVARHGDWESLQLPAAAASAADRVALDATQCAALIDAAEPDQLLHQLRASGSEPAEGMTQALAHEHLKFWLRCADHAQLINPMERLSLCETALTKPRHVDDSKIAEWLAQPTQPESLESVSQRWFQASANRNESTSP